MYTAQPLRLVENDSIETYLMQIAERGMLGFSGVIYTADGARILSLKGSCAENPMQTLADFERLKHAIIEQGED